MECCGTEKAEDWAYNIEWHKTREHSNQSWPYVCCKWEGRQAVSLKQLDTSGVPRPRYAEWEQCYRFQKPEPQFVYTKVTSYSKTYLSREFKGSQNCRKLRINSNINQFRFLPQKSCKNYTAMGWTRKKHSWLKFGVSLKQTRREPFKSSLNAQKARSIINNLRVVLWSSHIFQNSKNPKGTAVCLFEA